MSQGSGAVPGFLCYFYDDIKVLVSVRRRLSFPHLLARKINVLIFGHYERASGSVHTYAYKLG